MINFYRYYFPDKIFLPPRNVKNETSRSRDYVKLNFDTNSKTCKDDSRGKHGATFCRIFIGKLWKKLLSVATRSRCCRPESGHMLERRSLDIDTQTMSCKQKSHRFYVAYTDEEELWEYPILRSMRLHPPEQTEYLLCNVLVAAMPWNNRDYLKSMLWWREKFTLHKL